MIVLLDAGSLGLVTNPRATSESLRCKQWLVDLLAQGVRALVPEITDYEVRRELLRAGRARGIAHLDQFKATAGYVPLTTETMLLAADYWAQARRRGQPTAPDLALDADVILAAQAQLLAQREQQRVMIATTRVCLTNRSECVTLVLVAPGMNVEVISSTSPTEDEEWRKHLPN